MKLAALVSSGKDSLFATYLMKKKGHEIACLVTIKSRNKSSYMFHTP
ncbi:TIGR00289 family protein, partial [Candidatus Woesearchaeota archaeon CG08_land_8_20_14_0_20_47_9]